MAELVPYPFAALIRRAFHELRTYDRIFDLPRAKFHTGNESYDLSANFAGHRIASPLGPAAGPHTQMAQNLVLSWLGGSRFFELKTVQIQDELQIPRPCIDMRNVGYNAEWSQELKLEASLEEYVKGAMLVQILKESGELDVAPSFTDLIWDMSVGYDLAGIKSERVQVFLNSMLDCREVVNRLRKQIPAEFSSLRDLDFPERLSDTLTLSTFHGCPPEEIESIVEFLMRQLGIHCVVKFNPMLLGPEQARGLLHDELGYDEIRIPDSAFERDMPFQRAVEIMESLDETARELDLSLGAKFTNTLIVENTAGFLPPEEKEVYLSGAPLHVLAMHLVARFRRQFELRFPISFSAGIDKFNFPDAVALGLVPVTVCSDLLRTGGYGRLGGYYRQLQSRMDAVGAKTREEFILAEAARHLKDSRSEASQQEEASARIQQDLPRAVLVNTDAYLDSLSGEERYRQAKNRKTPKKIGSQLEFFDCVSCDKCLPVCPNDANFILRSSTRSVKSAFLERRGTKWELREAPMIELDERHQIANFADFCNECGNCDIFCPEDGGPYVLKPRFFGSETQWRRWKEYDGFFLEEADGMERVLGRFQGQEFLLEREGDRVRYRGRGFDLSWRGEDPRHASGAGPKQIDLTYYHLMEWLLEAALQGDAPNYIQSLARQT